MPEPDLNFVLRRLDAIQKELREGLRIMELRDEQREAAHQTLVQTLTRQMVSVATAVEERLVSSEQRLDGVEQRLGAVEQRLGSVEHMLGDIAAETAGRFDRLDAALAALGKS